MMKKYLLLTIIIDLNTIDSEIVIIIIKTSICFYIFLNDRIFIWIDQIKKYRVSEREKNRREREKRSDYLLLIIEIFQAISVYIFLLLLIQILYIESEREREKKRLKFEK